MMNRYEIREHGYIGQVWPSSGYTRQFYFYSVSRDVQREKLFDGVAGDIAEAVSSMRAHILFLTSAGGGNRNSAGCYADEGFDLPGNIVEADLKDDIEQWIDVVSAAA